MGRPPDRGLREQESDGFEHTSVEEDVDGDCKQLRRGTDGTLAFRQEYKAAGYTYPILDLRPKWTSRGPTRSSITYLEVFQLV